MGNILSQTFCIPAPSITEKNCPDQTGKVHIVTGGYTGLGQELVKILYQHNATIYILGRNEHKASMCIDNVRAAYPDSKGRLEFIFVDFSDLQTIKPAAKSFLAKEKHLHVLTLNAGVMTPPRDIKTAQGFDMQMGTNCLGPHLLYTFLRPILLSTAEQKPNASVRVTWAGSIAIDAISPKPGGIAFLNDTDTPRADLDPEVMYGQSKVGNLMLANVHGRRDVSQNVLHVCWNPGNLQTELIRHVSSFQNLILKLIMNPPIFGAYTELFAAVSTDLLPQHAGAYIAPWGRIGKVRDDVRTACLPVDEGGNGLADRFVGWCEKVTAEFL
ncbi:hypothetical protein AbraIFM66950_012146 [Aspergillus brasiliensis]|nr:hypothetical protein AbraIFM66950_012146 [Aspergillus brasiliensis]